MSRLFLAPQNLPMCHLTITTLSFSVEENTFLICIIIISLLHFIVLLSVYYLLFASQIMVNSVLLFSFEFSMWNYMLFYAWFIFFSIITLIFICFVVYSCNSYMHSVIYYQLCWCILNYSSVLGHLNIAVLITLVYTYVLTSVLWNQMYILQFNSILTLSIQSCCRPPKLKA